MNIFEMYYENGCRCGFWVVRRSWGNHIARIVGIADQTDGPLTGLGKYPFFNGAKQRVWAEIYVVRRDDGESCLELARTMWPTMAAPHDSNLIWLSCPGTYSYELVDDRRIAPATIHALPSQKVHLT